MNVPLRLDNRSRVKGDFYARICERLRGKFPGSTRCAPRTTPIEGADAMMMMEAGPPDSVYRN